MADPERYVTADELEAELPFDAADFPLQDETQFSNALERALGAASDAVDAWGETRYEPTDTEETLARPSHAPDHDLPLSKRPIQSVTSVEVDGDTLDASEYVVHDTHLELLEAAVIRQWPTDRRSITVSWTYGYETVPGPVREAIIRLVRNALDQIETDGYASDEDGWAYRPPAEIKAECAGMVGEHDAPSYYTGAAVI